MLDWFFALPDWIKFILILAVLLVIYLIFQVINYNRVRKQIMNMQNSLKIGDFILTQSGLYGTLKGVDEKTARLQIADNLIIVVDRFSIKEVVPADSGTGSVSASSNNTKSKKNNN